jgi:hypothetical protein
MADGVALDAAAAAFEGSISCVDVAATGTEELVDKVVVETGAYRECVSR